MSIYRDVSCEMEQEQLIRKMYRVESNKSSQNMKVNESGILKYQDGDIYTYFSLCERHHQYFLDKRLCSYLNDTLKQNDLSINKANILNSETYSIIKNLIIRNANLSSFLGIKLHTSSIVFDLLETNSCRIENKYMYSSRLPERSDPKKYGGGYGVCGPWLDLILNFTFFSEIHSYNISDVIEFLEQARRSYNIHGRRFWFEPSMYQIQLNQKLLSPFHKYDIVDSLEQIVEMKLVKTNSPLAKDSIGTIKGVRKEYENQKEKALRILEKKYKKYL